MYYVIGANGSQYGPVDEATLRAWIAEGRVGAPSLSFKSGEASWAPLSTREEFRDLFGSAAAASAPAAPAAGAPPAAPSLRRAAGAARARRARLARRRFCSRSSSDVRRRPLLPRPRGARPPEAVHARRLRDLVAHRRDPDRDEHAARRQRPAARQAALGPQGPASAPAAPGPRPAAARPLRPPSPPPSSRTRPPRRRTRRARAARRRRRDRRPSRTSRAPRGPTCVQRVRSSGVIGFRKPDFSSNHSSRSSTERICAAGRRTRTTRRASSAETSKPLSRSNPPRTRPLRRSVAFFGTSKTKIVFTSSTLQNVRNLHLDGREARDPAHGRDDGGRAGTARGRPSPPGIPGAKSARAPARTARRPRIRRRRMKQED